MYYGIQVEKILLNAIDAKQSPIIVYWKVKNLSKNEVLFEGQANQKLLEGIAGDEYKIVAKNADGSWAKVSPSGFKLKNFQQVIAVGKSSSQPQADCYVEIEANKPLGICYRDSRDIQECVKDKTYWKPKVNCGWVRVAGKTTSGAYASVSPSNQQEAKIGYIPKFYLTAPETRLDECPPISGTGKVGVGHISICGKGADLQGYVRSFTEDRQFLVNGDTQIADVEPGWYYINITAPEGVVVYPNPFYVSEGLTTSVKYYMPAEPQTTPPQPPVIPSGSSGGFDYPYYSTATETEEEITDKLKEIWSLYNVYIIALAGAGVGYYFYRKSKKEKK